MYDLRILPSAKQDISNAAKWYNNQLPGLGKKFITQFRRKAEIIRENPETYSIKHNNVRTAMLDSFPYMVHYFIDRIQNVVLISAVLHTSRKPGLYK